MRNVSDKVCRENQDTFYIQKLFFSKILPFMGIMWEKFVESGRPQVTIWRMCIACWINKATNTTPECVIFIAFPVQKLLHERAAMLRLRTLHVLFLHDLSETFSF